MKFVLGTAGLAWALLSVEAQAQVVLPPAQIDPGRVQQQARPPEAPREAPQIVTPEIPQNVAPAEAENTRITVSRIQIDGSTAYAAGAFDDLTTPLTGREISLIEAFRLADAITARYRRDDYILSRAVVPAQRIEDGVLRVQIVEGFISKVNFEGEANEALRSHAAELTAEKPLRGKVLERALLLMNDMAGVTARAVLAAAADAEQGGSELNIVVTRKAFDVHAGFDNHGSRYIGPIQYYAGVSFNDQLGLGERIALNYAGAIETSELQYISGRIDLPVGRDGLILSANAGYSHSRPGFVLRQLDARANGTTLGARLSYPLIRSRAQTLRLSAAFHYLDSRTVLNDMPDVSPSSHDRIRALRIGALYDFADRAGGQNLLEVEFTQGLSILGSLNEARPNPSRPQAKNDFRKLTAEFSRRQSLDAIGNGLALFGVVKAQTSFGDPLLSSEQFGVGGSAIGTAYDPSEIIGDRGVAARAELQYSKGFGSSGSAVQLYGFYDVGKTRNTIVQPGEPRSLSLSSAGGGMRFSLGRNLSGYTEIAHPLTRDVQARVLANRDPRPTRVFVGLTVRH